VGQGFLSIAKAQRWGGGPRGLRGQSYSRQVPEACLVKIAHYANERRPESVARCDHEDQGVFPLSFSFRGHLGVTDAGEWAKATD